MRKVLRKWRKGKLCCIENFLVWRHIQWILQYSFFHHLQKYCYQQWSKTLAWLLLTIFVTKKTSTTRCLIAKCLFYLVKLGDQEVPHYRGCSDECHSQIHRCLGYWNLHQDYSIDHYYLVSFICSFLLLSNFCH